MSTFDEMPQREVWFERDGTRLYALEVGQLDHDHPIVFMHGGLADHRAAMLYVGPLLAAHRVILPDLRGAGRSVFAGELSWQQLAADLSALLAHLRIERAAIGGSSMGSGVALRFALSHPEHTLGLLLTAPVFSGADRGLSPAQATAMQALGEAGEIALVRGIEALIPLYGRLPIAVRERAIEMLLSFDAASVATTTRLLASGAQPFGSADELAAIDVPVLVTPGTDAEHPLEVAELYVQHITHAQLAYPTSPELPETLARFCAALPWRTSS
jgi:pimeloyl-ACP methyl ester carboxylesterase